MDTESMMNTCRLEALRLFRVSEALLHSMEQEKDFLPENMEGGTFSATSIADDIRFLGEEQNKLQHYDLVVAAVGTMKAGKSTTINAIIGEDVLPNRNTPMTSLPTRIRHTVGQHQPLLSVPDTSAIIKLLAELQPLLREKIESGELDPVTKKNYESMINTKGVAQTYVGASGIFDFLKILNDLVRASAAFERAFPYEAFDSLDKLPLIEVEFAHLADMDSKGMGSFTLLDTPGPNEAGQKIMRHLMREQLKKASVLIAVLDYTGLNSEADEEVRTHVRDLQCALRGRLYALVNKFDERDRNGMDEEELRHYVSSNLLGGVIPPDAVFPISARWAYLANRARKELKVSPVLPAVEGTPWVADFAEAAFGKRWQRSLGNANEEQEGVEDLWAASKFEKPLMGVIRTGYANAALLTLDAALGRLGQLGDRLSTFTHNRAASLTKSIEEIEKAVKVLQASLNNLQQQREKTCQQKDKMQKQFSLELKQDLQAIKQEMMAIVDVYFTQGKLDEESRITVKPRRQEGRRGLLTNVQAVFASVMAGNNTTEKRLDFDPDSPIIRFEDRKEARELMKKIMESLRRVFIQAEKQLVNDMSDCVEAFSKKFTTEMVEEAQVLLSGLTQDMGKSKFVFNFSLPSPSSLWVDFRPADFLEDAIETRDKDVTHWKRQSGLWGTICSWCDTKDWGWESYQVTVQEYTINIQEIRSTMLEACDGLFSNTGAALKTHVHAPMEEAIGTFFTEFSTRVDEVRVDLEASMDSRGALGFEVEKMREFAQKISGEAEELCDDIKGLSHDVSKLTNILHDEK